MPAPPDTRALDPGGLWANLGAWSGTDDYVTAATTLARRHADAIALHAGDRLLELGCGQGAAAALWRQYGVTQLQLGDARGQPPDVLPLRFDTDPPPAWQGWATALICVDAAYHARSLQAFATTCAQLARPGARLAFSTLRRHRPQPLRRLRWAGIPDASQCRPEALLAILQAAGWSDVNVTVLDDVLTGFAAQVRERSLGWRQPGALKLRLTAALCDHLARSGAADYVLVSAVRSAH